VLVSLIASPNVHHPLKLCQSTEEPNGQQGKNNISSIFILFFVYIQENGAVFFIFALLVKGFNFLFF
jgi:hypothetical protein